MLVEHKFYFISLPRCASTSFMITCIKNNIQINHFQNFLDNQTKNFKNWKKWNNEKLADRLSHGHESIVHLENKFGNNYPIISIKRDKYERFISLWKHIIDETYRIKQKKIGDMFSEFTIDDLLPQFMNYENVLSDEISKFIHTKFLNKFKIPAEQHYIGNMMGILYSPISKWTNNDERIIWFDIKKLNELEDWVSNILNKPFKMEKINSSKGFNCGLVNDNYFKEKYDKIYNMHDFFKKSKTLI